MLKSLFGSRRGALPPGTADALFKRASGAVPPEHLAALLEEVDTALAAAPRNASLLTARGWLKLQAGDPADAADTLRRAVRFGPAFAPAHHRFGMALFEKGDLIPALQALTAAASLAPENPEVHWHLALAQWRKGDKSGARRTLARLLELAPDHLPGAELLGDVLQDLGALEAARLHYSTMAQRAPAYGAFLRGLGRVCAAEGDDAGAVDALERAVVCEPEHAEGWALLGTSRERMRRYDRALEAFAQAVELEPGNARSWARLGAARDIARDPEGARAAYARALALAPGLPAALVPRATCHRVTADDADLIDTIEAGLVDPDYSAKDRRRLYFALGKALDDLERWTEAFAAIDRGNRLRYPQLGYDPAAERARIERLIARFDAAALADRSDIRAQSRVIPVFIVGMPGSGATLLEAIFAAHPFGFGAGELPDLGRIAGKLLDGDVEDSRGPAGTDGTDAVTSQTAGVTDPATLAQHYRRRLEWDAPAGATHIVDRMPWNFLHLWLVPRLFPDATVIWLRRHPMDVALACYCQDFSEGNAATFDLEALAMLIEDHERLMAHWRSVLPGPVHEIRYEDIAADAEPAVRGLLRAAGLEFNAACVDVGEINEAVRSASIWQGHQPLYADAAGRWRRYQGELAPLADRLEDPIAHYEGASTER